MRAVAAPLLVGAMLFPGIALAEGGWDPDITPLRDGVWNRSLNWSGSAYESSTTNPNSGYVNDIKAQWVVPALTCVAGAPNATSSIWVGIDGFTTGTTVEQIGTQQICTNGVASYSPFYEMYPNPPTSFSLAVKPGDRMSAEVKYIGSGKFSLSLANLTTGMSYATTQTSTTALRQSAEFIVEAQT
ncbi:MAG TPA: G1 family glutamic endopeptidase, partial [Chloroflexota bacterium]